MVAILPKKTSDNYNNFVNDYYTQIVIVCSSLLVISIIILILIKYRSKWNKSKSNKKNSFSVVDNTGFIINSGTLSTNVTRTKKISNHTSGNSDSDSNEDILYDNKPFKRETYGIKKNYVIKKVQPSGTTTPKHYNATRQTSNSSVDDEIESESYIVLSVFNEGNNSFKLSLIKAKNLRRSGDYANDKLLPEGLFARLYLSNTLPSDNGKSSKSSNVEQNFYQTSCIKSKKSKNIRFNDSDKFTINSDQFPVRISLYEYDKRKTRLSVGHCFVNMNARDNYHTNQIIKLYLYPTIYLAQNVANIKN